VTRKEGFGPLFYAGAAQADALRAKLMIDPAVHKVNWQQVGRVAEPGRYLFTFGWLTITADDLAIWRQYPGAAFTLIVQSPTEAIEEYRLGAFEV
jgi:hypothetical protein